MLTIELSRPETYTLIRACHCRRDDIDKKVAELLMHTQNHVDEAAEHLFVSEIIALDGERFLLDQILARLWRIKDH